MNLNEPEHSDQGSGTDSIPDSPEDKGRLLITLHKRFDDGTKAISDREASLRKTISELKNNVKTHFEDHVENTALITRCTALETSLKELSTTYSELVTVHADVRSRIQKLTQTEVQAENEEMAMEESKSDGSLTETKGDSQRTESKESEVIQMEDSDDDDDRESVVLGEERSQIQRRLSVAESLDMLGDWDNMDRLPREEKDTQQKEEEEEEDDEEEEERPASPELVLSQSKLPRHSSLTSDEQHIRSLVETDIRNEWEEERRKLASELQLLRREQQKQQDEQQKLEEAYQLSQLQLSQTKKKLEQMKLERQSVDELQKRCTQLETAIENERRSTNERQEKLQNEFKQRTAEIDSLKTRLNDTQNALTNSNQTSKKLEEELKASKLSIQNVSEECKMLGDKLESVQKELQRTQEQHKTDIAQAKLSTEKYRKSAEIESHKVSGLNSRVEELARELNNAKETVYTLQGKINEQKQEIERLTAENKQLGEMSSETQRGLKQANDRVKEGEQLAEKLNATIAESKVHCDKLQAQLQIKAETIRVLKQSIQQQQQQQPNQQFKAPRPISDAHKIAGKRVRDEIDERELDVQQRSQRTAKKHKISKPIVTFSGFKHGIVNYTPEDKEKLKEYIKRLGGLAIETSERERLPDEVTHVVAQPTVRTMKVLGAALTGKWIVGADWVKESINNNEFITDETAMGSYGFRNPHSKFLGKSFYFTPQFIHEHSKGRQNKVKHAMKLIEEYCRGKVVTQKAGSDFSLVGENESSRIDSSADLTWVTFLEAICPSPSTRQQHQQGSSSDSHHPAISQRK